jgi:hypothetical protein
VIDFGLLLGIFLIRKNQFDIDGFCELLFHRTFKQKALIFPEKTSLTFPTRKRRTQPPHKNPRKAPRQKKKLGKNRTRYF